MNATAARARRRSSPKHQPLPRPLQRELDEARLDRDRAVSSIRGTFVHRQQELDRDRRRQEQLAWERFRVRETEIRGRAGTSPDLLKAITRVEAERPTPDLPVIAAKQVVVVDEHHVHTPEQLGRFAELGTQLRARRRWWHRMIWWRR